MEISQEKVLRYAGIGQLVLVSLFFVIFDWHLGYNVQFSGLIMAGMIFTIGFEKTVLSDKWNKLFLSLSAILYLYFMAASFLNLENNFGRSFSFILILSALLLSLIYLFVKNRAEKKTGIVKDKPKFKNF